MQDSLRQAAQTPFPCRPQNCSYFHIPALQTAERYLTEWGKTPNHNAQNFISEDGAPLDSIGKAAFMHTGRNCFNTWTFYRRILDQSFAGVVLPTDAQHPSRLHNLTNERQSQKMIRTSIISNWLAVRVCASRTRKEEARFDREISNCGQRGDGRYYQ